MLKQGITIKKKRGLNYIVTPDGRTRRYKPWLGDVFSFLYDFFMKNSIFPKKFGADMPLHFDILRRELEETHGKRVLELATGNGSAVNFLAADNSYTGTDISPGLLRAAIKNFARARFEKAEFYIVSADDLPFEDSSFDICLCILSLNFFDDLEKVVRETCRVLGSGGIFIASVPVPERNRLGASIRGMRHSGDDLRRIYEERGFVFASIPRENGALLYFRATGVG